MAGETSRACSPASTPGAVPGVLPGADLPVGSAAGSTLTSGRAGALASARRDALSASVT